MAHNKTAASKIAASNTSDTEQMNTIEALFGMVSQIETLYAQWAKAQGISYKVLAVIYSIHRYDGCTQKQVCDEWRFPKQTLSTVCKQLQEQGYIVFEQSLEDKREKLMRLTQNGEQMAEPLLEKFAAFEQRVLLGYGEKNANQLLADLQRLVVLLEENAAM